MEEILRTFRSVLVKDDTQRKVDNKLLKLTLSKGYVLDPKIVANLSEKELTTLCSLIESELLVSAEQQNNSFHKSWHKVATASMEQLVIEQVLNYITRYALSDQSYVYIPTEDLKIPTLKEGKLKFLYIKALTKEELKERVLALGQSTTPLKDTTLKDLENICLDIEFSEEEVETFNNKEFQIRLYKLYGLVPKDPVEFLRYVVYDVTGKTLLIKDKKTIETLKSGFTIRGVDLFFKYKLTYGFENLASIFYRFKPLFLAMKENTKARKYINKIRKLAVDHHKPLVKGYLESLTENIRLGKVIHNADLEKALDKVSTARKLKLLQALQYNLQQNTTAIMYKIRNGKAYATTRNALTVSQRLSMQAAELVVYASVLKDLRQYEGKTFYIPEHVSYGIPVSEKLSSNGIPFGTKVTVTDNLLAGVHWKDVNNYRVDLDLALLAMDGTKIGWNGAYRNEEKTILFSGDMTSAPAPKGASELFHIAHNQVEDYAVTLNYYNYSPAIPVPYKIILGQDPKAKLSTNYMIDPSYSLGYIPSVIEDRQKLIGFVLTNNDSNTFVFAETQLGSGNVSFQTEHGKQALKYAKELYSNSINIADLLINAGAIVHGTKDITVEYDYDLSLENISKDTLFSLFN